MKTMTWATCVIVMTFLPKPMLATTIQAESPSQSHVQAAIDSAHDGDTVRVPAGSATWRDSVVISKKSITLQGAGMTKTVIRNLAKIGVQVKGGEDKPFRITDLSFDGTGNANSTSIHVSNDSVVGFRIDHCRFYNERHMLDIHGVRAEGVVDHCQYVCLENKGSGDHVAIYVHGDGAAAWKRPPGLGTSAAVYVEDCEFEYFGTGNSDRPYLGMTNGAKVVFRHNKAKNGCFEAFGVSSYYLGARGTISLEVYNNEFSGNCYCLFTIKGGTATIFDNTITGYSPTCFELTDYRMVRHGVAVQYGSCNGMTSIDGNAPIEAGRHTGGNNESVLTCADARWTPNQWVGYAVWNETGDSVGRITANTENTITTTGGLVEGCTIVDAGAVTAVSE